MNAPLDLIIDAGAPYRSALAAVSRDAGTLLSLGVAVANQPPIRVPRNKRPTADKGPAVVAELLRGLGNHILFPLGNVGRPNVVTEPTAAMTEGLGSSARRSQRMPIGQRP